MESIKMKNNAQREKRENTYEKKNHWTSGMKEVSDNTTATKNLQHNGRTQLGT